MGTVTVLQNFMNASNFAECVLDRSMLPCHRAISASRDLPVTASDRSPLPVAMAKTGYVALTVDQWDHWLWNPVPDVQTYFSASVAVYKAIAGVGRRCLSEYFNLSTTDL